MDLADLDRVVGIVDDACDRTRGTLGAYLYVFSDCSVLALDVASLMVTPYRDFSAWLDSREGLEPNDGRE